MGDVALLLAFACAIVGLALAAPRLAHRGERPLFVAWAAATLMLTGIVLATDAASSRSLPSMGWSVMLLATLGTGFAALAGLARWRQKRRTVVDGGAVRATIGDVVLGVLVWIGAAALAWVIALVCAFTVGGPIVN